MSYNQNMSDLVSLPHIPREDLAHMPGRAEQVRYRADHLETILRRAEIEAGKRTLPTKPVLPPEFQTLLDLAINS